MSHWWPQAADSLLWRQNAVMRATWIISDTPLPWRQNTARWPAWGSEIKLVWSSVSPLRLSVRSCCARRKDVSSQLSVPRVSTGLRPHSNSLSEAAFFLANAIAGATLRGGDRHGRFHRRPPNQATNYWKHFNLIPERVTDNHNPIYRRCSYCKGSKGNDCSPGTWRENSIHFKTEHRGFSGKWVVRPGR